MKKGIALATVLILLFSFQTAFGIGKNYGLLKKSTEVNDMFVSHQVLPDHKYYYSGSNAAPNAIIGIHNDYTLESKLWKPVDLTTEQLKKWLNNMLRNRDRPATTWGAYITGPGGKKIGIWFSRWNRTTIKMLDGNRVQIHTPSTMDDPSSKRAFGGGI